MQSFCFAFHEPVSRTVREAYCDEWNNESDIEKYHIIQVSSDYQFQTAGNDTENPAQNASQHCLFDGDGKTINVRKGYSYETLDGKQGHDKNAGTHGGLWDDFRLKHDFTNAEPFQYVAYTHIDRGNAACQKICNTQCDDENRCRVPKRLQRVLVHREQEQAIEDWYQKGE